jgi:hypothetical protein
MTAPEVLNPKITSVMMSAVLMIEMQMFITLFSAMRSSPVNAAEAALIMALASM